MKLCLGTVQFGLDYGIQGNKKPKKSQVYEMLEYAIDNGIEIFDTASEYGKAEEIIGNFIRTNINESGRVHIVSKLNPSAFREGEEGKWPKIAVESAKRSLGNLAIGRFEAYLFHNASYIFDRRAVEALEQVKERGLADWIGVSIYSPKEAMKALDYPEISIIQIPYNVFDRRLDKCGFFNKAKEQGVLIFARSSLLQGLVMMEPDMLPDKVVFAKRYLQVFLQICRKYDQTPLRTAIAYVLKKKEIDHVVFGIDTIEQLKEYIAIGDVDLPQEMVQEIDEKFDEVEEKLVNPSMWR